MGWIILENILDRKGWILGKTIAIQLLTDNFEKKFSQVASNDVSIFIRRWKGLERWSTIIQYYQKVYEKKRKEKKTTLKLT